MSKNKKFNSNIKGIKTSFDANSLTNYSGAYPIYKFIMKLGLINKLDDINIQLHHNIQYTTSQLILAVLLGLTSGMNRATKIEGFTLDPLIQTILRLDGSISDSTFKDRFSRFSMNETNQYMNIIGKTSSEIHNKLKTSQDILDIDSTVRTVYGRQEGAEKGFNEVKKGAKSYLSY